MGKNVYETPRKGPAGKHIEKNSEKCFMKNQSQEKQERLAALAATYKKNKEQVDKEC